MTGRTGPLPPTVTVTTGDPIISSLLLNPAERNLVGSGLEMTGLPGATGSSNAADATGPTLDPGTGKALEHATGLVPSRSSDDIA